MEINEKKIRDYLLRQVANSNKRIVAVMYNEAKSSRDSFNGGFNEIISFFAGGMHGETILTVFNAIENNPKKRYSAYNFFDIDTLISYNAFLQDIVAEVDAMAVLNGRTKPTSRDFRNGFTNAKINLKENAGTEKSGFYDKNRPIKLAYVYEDGRRYLDPVKAMSRDAFTKKYSIVDCQQELKRYMANKHGLTILEKPKQEIIKYNFEGQDFDMVVYDKEYYTDQNGKGVVSLRAKGDIGILLGTYYNDGSVFEEGDLYDLNGEYVTTDGGVTLIENKNFASKLREQKKVKDEPEFVDVEYPQMTLFDD